jgi:hypothetical protein
MEHFGSERHSDEVDPAGKEDSRQNKQQELYPGKYFLYDRGTRKRNTVRTLLVLVKC